MNRRKFIQSMAAAFALPASPIHILKPAAAALPSANAAASAAAMATKARFWTIYTLAKQGSCTPATLSTILNIPESQAGGYLSNLIADGTIKPHALLRNSVTKLQTIDDDNLVGKVRKRLDTNADSKVDKIEAEADNTATKEAETGEVIEETAAVVEEDLPAESEGEVGQENSMAEVEHEVVYEGGEVASSSPDAMLEEQDDFGE